MTYFWPMSLKPYRANLLTLSYFCAVFFLQFVLSMIDRATVVRLRPLGSGCGRKVKFNVKVQPDICELLKNVKKHVPSYFGDVRKCSWIFWP